MKFNPTIKDFLKENPDVSVLGLYWAGMWRFMMIYLGIVLGFTVIFGGL